MSEWLGKPKIDKKDIEKYQPTFVENFPTLTRYFVDAQKLRVTVLFDYDRRDKFLEKVKKKYGKVTPKTLHDAADAAIDEWIKNV